LVFNVKGGVVFHFFLVGVTSFYVLWVCYLAVMNLKRAQDNNQLTKLALCLGYPVLIFGLLLDVLVNWVFGTLMFLELPKETVLTSRLKRHRFSESWRGVLAAFICNQLLNQFDPSGTHCGEDRK
jgi:hypothetical protein